jgi:hypothetical protein
MGKLQFDISEYYDKAKRLSKKISISGVTISLPFISLDFAANDKEKKIAREIIIRLRDKRVLNSKECCDNCIRNSLDSLIEIRKFLVDKEVEIDDVDSPLFLLVDFAIFGIREFMTFTEYYQPDLNRHEYFEALQIIRNHLLRLFDQIALISELPDKIGYRYEFTPDWDKSIYFLVNNKKPLNE